MERYYDVEIPMGLERAMSKNPDAMRYFNSLPSDQQSQIICTSHRVTSKQEMTNYVNEMFRLK